MFRKNMDGIAFDDTVYLTEECYKRFPIYMRLLQALVMFIGSYCFITIFTGCLNLLFINSRLLASITISGLVFFALFLYPKYDTAKSILLSVIYGGFIFHRFKQLLNGFFLLENAIIERASYYYGFEEFRYVADYKRVEEDITLILIMIIIPIAALITISLLRGRLKLICYIAMLIPIITSFAMGLTPPEADFIAYILAFLFIVISNSFSHAKSSQNKKSGVTGNSMIYRISIRSASILCLMVLMLFFIIKQFVPVEAYESYEGIYETKTKIQGFLTDLQNYNIPEKLPDIKLKIIPGKNTSPGGLNLGQLGRVDEVVYDDTEHLQINAPLQSVIEGIYLRGYIGSEYTGDSWVTHTRQSIRSYNDMITGISVDEFHPVTGTAALLSQTPFSSYIKQGRIDIKYINANRKYVYAPYFTIFNKSDEINFEYDLSVIANRDIEQASYLYSYNVAEILEYSEYDLPSALGLLLQKEIDIQEDGFSAYRSIQEYRENESKYRDFVYKAYTGLPEQGLDRLKHDFSREAVGPSSENIRDAIEYVKAYLNRIARYTLAPGKLPRGKDFVEYFLYENKLGYCSHFASAGALMLRAMGYPSRYVEGYAISRSDLMNQVMTSYAENDPNNANVIVKDSNAHAWVEVYIDGFGWIPVEFTVGSGMEDMVDILGGIYQPGEIKEDQAGAPTPTPTPTERPPRPTTMPNENIKPSPAAPEKNGDTRLSDSLEKDGDKPKAGFGWYLILIILIILMLGATSYYFLVYRRKTEINNESYSNRALRLYKKIERLFIINHGLPRKAKSLEENEDYAKEHLRLLPVEDFEICMEVVRKARFGRDSISPSEYLKVVSFYEAFKNRVYEGLPQIKKVYFRLIQEIDCI